MPVTADGAAVDGKGVYDSTAITIPKYGTSTPGSDLAADGTTVVLTMQDYGAVTLTTNIYDQGGTFADRCGESLISLKAGSPSWVTLTQDSGTKTTYALSA